jgi:predicted unusual protein kinase regulating ubiquinone biosynthesis (AarF/ABC1/UbiB family)
MIKRTAIVLWKIAPIILSFVKDFKRYIFWGSGRTLTVDEHQQRAKDLTKTLGDLGPTFIKLAQVLSTRADVLPKIYIQELSTLQDKVDPNPTDEIKQVISTELQQPVEAIFDSFEESSLAAASLGQVHRARYHGEPVAVKVLRPGVPQLVQTDLNILQGILNVLNRFTSDHSLLKSFITVFNEFRRVIVQEMDFELEARNVKVFQRNLRHEEFVVIPKVYDELTTKKVLVLEYLEGVKINEVDQIEQMGIDIDLIIQRLAKIYIHQVLIDGFLHADPHPGNIFVDRQGRIIILDFGMVIRIDESFKRHLIKYAVALANHNIDGMVNEMYELQLVEEGTNKAALRDLARLMLEIQEQGKLSAHKVQHIINTLMEVFYDFPFTLPSELVYIGRATSLIEGIGFIHDPWFDAVAVGRPIIKEMAQEILKEEFQGDFLETLQQWVLRSYQTAIALQDIILKTDREQLRLRLHPADLQNIRSTIESVTRKILTSIFATLLGIMASIIYLRNGNTYILITGIFLSGMCLLVLILLPSKRPDTRYRHYIRKQFERITTEEGELYKSFIISQMTPEEREKAEAEKQKGRRAEGKKGRRAEGKKSRRKEGKKSRRAEGKKRRKKEDQK